uniref:Cytochrome P450 2L1-like n=1 Tax=Hirondellea gigas TaxID=1518452 RepID=A0A2P2I2W4_9CRUS
MILELSFLFLLLLLYLYVTDRKPSNMPPGPTEIPILGGMPVLDEKQAHPLREKYGDIVTVRTGAIRTVILFDYKTSKEVMARADMAGRPDIFKAFSIDEQKTGGIALSEGPQWQHDRRFMLRNLRNLGMGKTYLEDAVHVEAEALVEDLKKYDQQPIAYPDSFRTAALNIIWQMTASRRYDLRSEEVKLIYEASKDLQSSSMALTMMPFFFPFLRKLPNILQKIFFKQNLVDAFIEKMRATITKTVDEHEEQLDLDNPRDLIDEYLKEMKEQEHDKETLYRKGALLQIVNDLFDAGSDTINTTIKWVVYVLARYPQVTKKIQHEIDEVVPRDRMVSLQDKPNLPYVEAFITEILRFSSLTGLNVEHTAMQDTTIEGYFIPKGTVVVNSNYAIHFDPQYWDQPHNFSPERFIDEDGKFQAPKEGFFAFSSGRRQCPAETLARMEVFLFATAIIQNLEILVPDGVQLSDDTHNLLGIRVPVSDTFIYKPRS